MSERQTKHLEFIQANISRMNQNSFHMKGWCIAVVSALLAIYAGSIDETGYGNAIFIFVAIIPTLLFWFLDSYYLQQERKFLGIYNDVAGLNGNSKKFDIQAFEMPLQRYTKGKYGFINVMLSKTEWPLYFTIIIGLITAGALLNN